MKNPAAETAGRQKPRYVPCGRDHREQDILFCVVTRLEIGGIKGIAKGIDPATFIVIHPLADAEGGVIRQSLLTGKHS